MARDWHELFKSWSKPPTETEEAKGSTAAEMIKDALRSYPPLQQRIFDVYPTGSYRNNTNVRLGSDIDVAVVLRNTFYYDFPPSGSWTKEMLAISDSKHSLDDFRDEVGVALSLKFGAAGMTPGDKTFNVHESSRRLDADVTPFLAYRRYTGQKNADGSWHYLEGTETRPQKNPSQRIINWHQQHYTEGVLRNEVTKRRFKRITRILKRLRNEMRDSPISRFSAAAEPVPSFLIECLVFNAPDSCFNREDGSYYQDVRETLLQLWNGTKEDSQCKGYLEVSRLKSLFGTNQAWSRTAANEFLLRAWEHVGFK
jgi:hypothetical protein